MKRLFAFGVVGICLAIASCSDSKPNDVPFDSGKWKVGGTRERGQMAHDIYARRLLIGKTREQVTQLLGPGSHEDPTFISYEISYGSILEKVNPARLYLIVEFGDSPPTVSQVTFADG